jgi:UDP-2,4-diacetamido-2,4,6-trideoxy-beta-L-altropyranose hydrolase
MRITFRPVSLVDSQALYDWRNSADVREFSRNSEFIAFENHVMWLRDRIERIPSEPFWIISLDGDVGGYVRFEKQSESTDKYEVSILLDPCYRGYGLGRRVLWEANTKMSRELGNCTIIAHVNSSNTSSLNTFVGLGFQILSLENSFFMLSIELKSEK